jgi:hypothetical protein
MIKIYKKLIFNKNDFNNNEGFYPILYNEYNLNKIYNKLDTFNGYSIKIYFYPIIYLNNNIAWVQLNGNVIIGFDDNNGLELLKSLNDESGIDGVFIINSGGRIIYPVIYNSPYRVLGQLQ